MLAAWRRVCSMIGLLLASAHFAFGAEEIAAPARPILAIDAGGHTGWVSKLLVNGYHDQLISVCRDRTIRCWDLHSGKPLRVLRPPIGPGIQGQI